MEATSRPSGYSEQRDQAFKKNSKSLVLQLIILCNFAVQIIRDENQIVKEK
jgi:hypothetical protein